MITNYLKKNSYPMAILKVVSATLLLSQIACTTNKYSDELYEFKLKGGHFYGPGPILPDTALPPGALRNIHFDIKKFKGFARFQNDGTPSSLLSDGKTQVNQNIDAGHLEIGGGDNTVLLVAVEGGPNKGREFYQLDENYAFVWNVDLALDPGFSDGIVRVDNFKLTTGLIKIANSWQTELGIPNGYDQAGSLMSGDFLAGRVGDFNQDGYLDGVVVAGPRVPMESQMLPGSPVGNKRGFETNVKIPAHMACELTLRGILQFEDAIAELAKVGDSKQAVILLKDISDRVQAAQSNMDHALLHGEWSKAKIKQEGFSLSDRMESLKILSFISLNILEHYPVYGGKFSGASIDAINKMFTQTKQLVKKVNHLNENTSVKLPSSNRLLKS